MRPRHGTRIAVWSALLVAAVLFIALQVTAAAAPAAPEPYSFLDGLNAEGYGHFSGRLQLFLMRRNFRQYPATSDGDANAGTMALTLGYETPDWHGLGGGLQFVASERLFESGSRDHANGADWLLANSDFTILNHAYLRLNLKELGLEKTTVFVGRKALNLDFAPTYQIRQKQQSYEGVFLTVNECEVLSLSLGHIERYSSWSSRDDTGNHYLDVDFVDIAQLERRYGVNYSTRGMQFVSATYTGLPHTSLTAYDFYGEDLYNTFGAKAAYTVPSRCPWTTTLKAHYVGQRDVGRMDRDGAGDIRANLYDVAVQLKKGAFCIEPGYTTLTGDDDENDLHVPFRTLLTIDPEMLWYTDQFRAGSDSWYVKTTYARGKTKFYALYVATMHENNVRGGALDQEANIVVSHAFTKNLAVAVKVGAGHRDNGGGARNTTAEDWRLFVAYSF